MLIKQLEDRGNQAPTSGSAPLGRTQCQHLIAVVGERRPDWSVELHHDPISQPMIVILPESLDDATGPTLVVYSDETAFHLDELRWDVYRRLGDYHAWGDVVGAVRISLESADAAAGSGPLTSGGIA